MKKKTTAKTLTIEVIERRIYIVPEILVDEFKAELRVMAKDKVKTTDYMEELLATVETREGAEEIQTKSVKEMK